AIVNGRRQLFVMPFTGGPSTRVTNDADDHRSAEWVGDSAMVFMTNLSDSGYVSIATLGADGRWGPVRRFTGATAPGRGTGSFHRARGLAAVDRAGYVVVVPERGGDPHLVLRGPETGGYSWPAWSEDGSRIYFLLDNGLDVTGIWSVPAGGGRPTLLVRFDDPTRPWHRFGFRVRRGRLYFTLGEMESDIWVAAVRIE
ncbi:MAG: TolB family protein, partial [Gemmatimonadales bacterium]